MKKCKQKKIVVSCDVVMSPIPDMTFTRNGEKVFQVSCFVRSVVSGILRHVLTQTSIPSLTHQTYRIWFYNMNLPALPASSAGLTISNIEVNNVSLADQAGFSQWILVKAIAKDKYFCDITKSPLEAKLTFCEKKSDKKTLWGWA